MASEFEHTPSSRNPLHRLRKSIAVRCLAGLIVYVALLALVLWGINRASENLFDSAFPSMETVLTYADDLEHDRFDALQTQALEHCKIVIFDGDGTRLYASSARAAEKIHASDLDLISEYDEQSFYEVFQESTVDGLHYRIVQCTYSLEDGFTKRITAWCELDENLTVVAGDLFADRGALTQREFDFLQGVYSAQMSVERVSYQTVDGEERILVLAAPLVSGIRYQQVVDEANRLPLLAAPVALVITIGCAWYLVGVAKRATRPLDRAINAYRRGDEQVDAATDVPTELVPIYDNFTDLMDELREAREDSQRIIANISHDLKTPLTVIYGYAQAFRDGRVPPEKEQDYHRIIGEKALAASELIDTLFAYAKMEHPEYAPNLEPWRVDELARSVAREAEAQVEQAGCSLFVVPEGTSLAQAARGDESPGTATSSAEPIARIDRQLFHRLLMNLISNACAHNPSGTSIYLACEVDAGRGLVRVRVADTGTGIPDHIASHAFDPFVTENAARSTNGGTGLGLTIARRAAELMGGTLTLSPNPPHPCATEFVIELPRCTEE